MSTINDLQNSQDIMNGAHMRLGGRLHKLSEAAILYGDMQSVNQLAHLMRHPSDVRQAMFLSIKANKMDMWEWFAQQASQDTQWWNENHWSILIPEDSQQLLNTRTLPEVYHPFVLVNSLITSVNYEHTALGQHIFELMEDYVVDIVAHHAQIAEGEEFLIFIQAMQHKRQLERELSAHSGTSAAPKRM